MISQKKTAEQAVGAVFALDLEPIKFKLMDRKEGYGWSREEADRRELEYKRFLALVAKYPDATITPDAEVDKFWHAHILDTLKYAEDCHEVFGEFLHHFPYFGMRDEEDAARLAEAAAATRELYRREFGGQAGESGDAYCARAAGPARSDVNDVSYCAATNAGPAYCAAPSSYCARAAAPASAYCAAAGKGGHGILAKGRPVPEPLAA